MPMPASHSRCRARSSSSRGDSDSFSGRVLATRCCRTPAAAKQPPAAMALSTVMSMPWMIPTEDAHYPGNGR